jgi:predicted transglutaminase-like cysteine proteinase
MANADLQLVIVHDRRAGQGRAVVAARLDGSWLILDNRTMLLLADADVRDLSPLIALDGRQDNRSPTVVAAAQ